jgi:hypothetical protein
MNFLHQIWLRLAPPLQTREPELSVDCDPLNRSAADPGATLPSYSTPKAEFRAAGAHDAADGSPQSKPFFLSQWFLNDILFIAMLVMALVGVILRLPVIYWIILTPVFGLISIAEGWSHFKTQRERLALAYRVAAIWGALLLCIYLLYSSSVEGVLNANASSLAMMTLIALGTFAAGVQARVWQICAVGGLLFLAVPGVGWLDQSPLLLAAAAFLIVLLGGLVWWIKQIQSDPVADEATLRDAPSVATLDASRRSS